jgi:hypothetical protein
MVSIFLPEEFGWKAPIKKGPDIVNESGARDLDKDVDELQIAVEDLGELYPLTQRDCKTTRKSCSNTLGSRLSKSSRPSTDSITECKEGGRESAEILCVPSCRPSGLHSTLLSLNLGSRIDKITQRLDEAEDDNMRNLTHLNNKIKEASVAQASAIVFFPKRMLSHPY